MIKITSTTMHNTVKFSTHLMGATANVADNAAIVGKVMAIKHQVQSNAVMAANPPRHPKMRSTAGIIANRWFSGSVPKRWFQNPFCVSIVAMSFVFLFTSKVEASILLQGDAHHTEI